MDVIYFSSRICEYQQLSNFHMCPFTYLGVVYKSAEHCYQRCKFTDANIIDHVISADTPLAAKRIASTYKGSIRHDWYSINVIVMQEILENKFLANPHLKQLLIYTGNSILIEHSRFDKFWGATKSGNGENMLGRILMTIRDRMHISDTYQNITNTYHT
jgi:ribA/ribD-fused uncharacterized protein